jgi:hypothetical protein
MINGKTLAITTGCRDRQVNLKRVLPSWLALPEPDLIIIVDWTSKAIVSDSLSEFQDSRLTIIRALDQKHWHNSKCHNLELQLAGRWGCNTVLRIDNDVSLKPGFFSAHPIEDKTFYSIDCHAVPSDCDDKRNLCGTVLVNTSDFQSVNGYNERLCQYGFEDEDLYSRLQKSGVAWKQFYLDLLDHIPHDDRLRFENLPVSEHLAKLKASLSPTQSVKDILIGISQHDSFRLPWTISDAQTQWTISPHSERLWTCAEVENPC